MRAVVLNDFGGPECLRPVDLPRPRIAPHNEVLIEVRAAAVNAFDAKLRRGSLREFFPLPPYHVLGCDVAGVVLEKGFDVSELDVGDHVYGLLDPMRPGAYAEYAASKAWLLRRMPPNLDFPQAAAIPMAGCTAWIGLVDLAKAGKGTRILVTGAGGCVGNFAIQLGKHLGAWVAAWIGESRAGTIKPTGADLVLDCPIEQIGEALSPVDVVLDTVGGTVNLASYAALRRGGTMLMVVRRDPVERAARKQLSLRHRVSAREIVFEARPDILDSLRPLFEHDVLRPPPICSYGLEEAEEAHRALEGGGCTGKVVLKVGS